MRKSMSVGLVVLSALAIVGGCAKPAPARPPVDPAAARINAPQDVGDRPGPIADGAPIVDGPPARTDLGSVAASSWIGASAESEMLYTGTRETYVGVWVDVPDRRPAARPPMELALVVDTSGSMAGAKIENARIASSMLVRSLRDGDIVALDAFSDVARTVVPPTRLDGRTRDGILRAIERLSVTGSTNMFDGLTLAEGQVAAAPSTHGIRRIVVVSDGIANVGPATPEALGAVAERGLRYGAQVTSLGVGTDYDERTLDALAVRSSGRLYHLTEPRQMASILQNELGLLDATVANGAFIEIVPAPGVSLVGAEGVRSDWQSGVDGDRRSLRIPLGALHAGQHREALVRVRIDDPSLFEQRTRSLASVRLRFRDAQDGDLERLHETVARAQLTRDSAAVASHVSSRTKAIVAIQESAKMQLSAAQRINDGNFASADTELAQAEAALAAQAEVVTAPADKKRLDDVRSRVAAARASTQAMPSKPKAAQRAGALELNANGMHDSGF